MNLKKYSKKVKLPKKMWEKGRSKFLFCRQEEDARRKPITPPVIIKSWYRKLYGSLVGLFTKT